MEIGSNGRVALKGENMLIVRYHDILGKWLGDQEFSSFEGSVILENFAHPGRLPLYSNFAFKAFVFEAEEGETLAIFQKMRDGSWKATILSKF